MKRTLTIIGLGLAGIVLALGVSVAAFALVGSSLSEPATGIRIPATTTPKTPSDDASRTHTPSPSTSPSEDPSSAPPSASPSDDHGGNSGSGGGEPGDDSGGSGGGHGSDD